jgi:hypothetical protein
MFQDAFDMIEIKIDSILNSSFFEFHWIAESYCLSKQVNIH